MDACKRLRAERAHAERRSTTKTCRDRKIDAALKQQRKHLTAESDTFAGTFVCAGPSKKVRERERMKKNNEKFSENENGFSAKIYKHNAECE